MTGAANSGALRTWGAIALWLAVLVTAACSKPGDATAALRRGQLEDTVVLMLKNAERGDAQAQNSLGVLYYLGSGTPRDYAKALHWFELAAIAGNASAQRHLGSMFRQGLGTPKDDFRAFGWYDAAHHSGDPHARDYMAWTALVVGPNQQALGRRLIAKDLKDKRVSHGSAQTGFR
ncbi:MAG: sel1 repeat family protein [Gammaproteobacteria bacterium]|nr:sel1 repeat family protein [Gammaproteobacteria bacterium]